MTDGTIFDDSQGDPVMKRIGIERALACSSLPELKKCRLERTN